MKIKIVSDLHLESWGEVTDSKIIYHFPFHEDELDTTLIIAGDLGPIAYRGLLELFLSHMCSRFKYVIYVLGNHEFYGSELNYTRTKIKSGMFFSNLYLLDDDIIELEGIKFIGSTLWTDMDKCSPIAMTTASRGLNDFHYIKIANNEKNGTLSPMDSYNLHLASMSFIEKELNSDFEGPIVIVTHHLPSELSIDPKYLGSPLNCCFASNLTNFIEKYSDKIVLWVHGHTHSSMDYFIDSTRIVCNPMGYSASENGDFNENLIIEI